MVGAGSIGLHAAYHLALRGHRVTVVEAQPAVRDGASFGNAGFVVPSHFIPLAAPGIVGRGLRWLFDPTSPFYVKPQFSADLLHWGIQFVRSANAERVRQNSPTILALNLQSRELWNALISELPVPVDFEQTGLLMLCRTEQGLDKEALIADQANELGLRASVLTATEVRQREPDIELAIAGATFFPDDARMNPQALMQALQAHLASMNVTFRFGTSAERVKLSRGRVVGLVVAADMGSQGHNRRHSPETIGAREEILPVDHLVLANGSWAVELAHSLGARLLLQPGKGYTLTANTQSQRLRAASILVEASIAASTLGNQLRIGGAMELSGFASPNNSRRIAGIRHAAQQYFPALDKGALEHASIWSGLRPLSPDGLPYLGRAPKATNAIIATGHAMMGFSAGPATGRTIAELVSGEKPTINIERMSVDRYG